MPILTEVIDQQEILELDHQQLEQLIEQVLLAQGIQQAEINLLIVDNVTIHGINLAHLEHDFSTDVITFPLNDPGQGPPEYPLEGEIVVSAEMAGDMAEEVGWSATAEFSLYVVHGLLHLCGYDDLEETAQAVMRRRELEVLRQLGIAPVEADARWQGLNA